MTKVIPFPRNESDAGLLSAILEQLLSLHRKVDRLLVEREAATAADAPLGELLTQAYGAFQTTEFTVRDLLEFSTLPVQGPLHSALAAVGNARSVGRMLMRAKGAEVVGLRLCHVRRSPEGHVWMVTKL